MAMSCVKAGTEALHATSYGHWMSEESNAGLVSIIIPTFNRARLVVDALDSVATQEYRPLEVIVVDDGSTDDTRITIQNWVQAHGDPRLQVRYIRQPNRGVSAARNVGLIESRGEFVQFLDSDDLLAPGKIAVCVEELGRTERAYVYGVSAFLDRHGRCQATTPGRTYHAHASHLPFIALALWDVNSPLYRRHVCIDAGPWDESLVGAEDQEYHARIKLRHGSGGFVDRVVDYVRYHDGEKATHPRTREQSLKYARSLDAAYTRIGEMMRDFAVSRRVEWNLLARNFAANAIRFVDCGDATGAHRSLRRAAEVARWPHRPGYFALSWFCRVLPMHRVLSAVRALANRTFLRRPELATPNRGRAK